MKVKTLTLSVLLVLGTLLVGYPALALADGKGWDYYIVVPGDTLYGIAKRVGTTIPALLEMNELKSTMIVTGQRLKVPSRNGPGGVESCARRSYLYTIDWRAPRAEGLYFFEPGTDRAKFWPDWVDIVRVYQNNHARTIMFKTVIHSDGSVGSHITSFTDSLDPGQVVKVALRVSLNDGTTQWVGTSLHFEPCTYDYFKMEYDGTRVSLRRLDSLYMTKWGPYDHHWDP